MQEAKITNIVKQVCQELGINQAELARLLEVSKSSITDWNKGNIPKMTKMALELLLENTKLKNQLKIVKEAHEIVRKIKL